MVRVAADSARTRFLLDSLAPTMNMVLGYSDCHTDDSGAAESKVYVNERYEMTATCEVRHNADGEPESSLIRFDLGGYRGDGLLSLSFWNGEYYASYESLGIDMPDFERDGQLGSMRVATDPAGDAVFAGWYGQRAVDEFGAGVCGFPYR